MIYGFVYIWMDVKRKMFYIGSHMGSYDDGYIGSNERLKRAYKKRPGDFKRRIIYILGEKERKILQIQEERWLQMIRVEELGIKYYNLKRSAAGGNIMEFYTADDKEKYRAKLRESANRGKDSHLARKVVCAGKMYETINDAISEIGFNPQYRLRTRRFVDFYYFDQGPITEEEIRLNEERKKKNKESGIKARAKGIANMTEEQQRAKGQKSAKTRKDRGLDYSYKISEALRNRPGRKVSIDGVIYDKGRIAAEQLGMIYGTVKVRLRSRSFPNWFYLDNPIKN